MGVDVKKYNFGIFGMGFLGNAIAHGFSLHSHIKAYDKFLSGFDSINDVIDHADVIWMCLPTPMMLDTGEIDLSILEENLQLISDRVDDDSDKIVIIKSTVTPGTTTSFAKKYPKLKFIMNPEFLTERDSRFGFISQARIILGSDDTIVGDKLEEIYRYRFGNTIPIYRCNFEQAELVKYGANCFFALKISYYNLIDSMCDKMGVDFDEVRDMINADARIARSHSNVPGWDGKKGWGGNCFVKDVHAFIVKAKEIGVDPGLLEAAWEQNLKDRPSHDWLELGPSVITKADKT